MSRPTERPAPSWPSVMTWTHRDLAQFVFYTNCKHGSCLKLSYMQMQTILLEEDDAIPAKYVGSF